MTGDPPPGAGGPPVLFDPGLQPERTRLAWRRTLLSLGVGALVALRLLPPAAGAWFVPVGVAGLLAVVVLAALGRRRAGAVDRALAASAPLPGAGLLALLAGCVTAGAAVALVVVLR